MIRRVWFAQDVCKEMKDRDATLSICMNSVTQFMQVEARRHGNLHVDIKNFDKTICRITKEAIASLDPHLRSVLGIFVRRTKEFDYGDVEVHLSVNYKVCLESNPGVSRIH